MGTGAISSLSQFIPTEDEVAKVRKYVKKRYAKSIAPPPLPPLSAAAAAAADEDPATADDATSAPTESGSTAADGAPTSRSDAPGVAKNSDAADNDSTTAATTASAARVATAVAAVGTGKGSSGKDKNGKGSKESPAELLVSDEEVNNLDAAALVKLKVGKAEQYIFFISQVSKLETRLSALSLALSAPEAGQNIVASSETVLNATNEVQSYCCYCC